MRSGRGTPGKDVLQARGAREKHWIFLCVGEWTLCKKPVSAMMCRGQRRLRLT